MIRDRANRTLTARQAGSGRKGPPPVHASKNFKSRQELIDAIDRASGGLLGRVLGVLDDGSQHLAALSTYAGRPPRWRLRTWRDAIAWTVKENSSRWVDLQADRLRSVSEAIGAALAAGGGGVDELSRHGLQWPGLVLPEETLRALESEPISAAAGAGR